MDFTKTLILLGVCLVVFSSYFFVGGFNGADNYFFMAQVCQGNSIPSTVSNPGAVWFFSLLPCSVPIYKAIGLALLFACCFLTSCIGELFNKKDGWWAGLLLFITPAWFMYFTMWEDDTLAFPFLFLGAFVLLYKVVNDKKSRLFDIAGFGLFGLGALFWSGSIFFFIAFSFVSLIGLVPAVMATLLYFESFLISITPRLGINEDTPLLGLLFAFVLLAGYWFVPKALFIPVVVFSILAFLKIKYSILLFPFLAVCLALLVSKLYEENNKVVLPKFVFDMVKPKAIWIGLGITILASCLIPYLYQTPDSNIQLSIKESIQIDKNVQNDWSFGHWILFAGGSPSSEFGPPTTPFVCDYRPVLTVDDLNSDFELYSKNGIYKVYICNGGRNNNAP